MVDQVTAIVRDLERGTERLIKKLTLDVTANLVETNPVDTGWSRANWVPNIGKRIRQPVGGDRPTVENAAAAATVQASAKASILAYKLSRGRVFISNNVRYITRLNEGSSRQAPAGFVQRAIAKAVQDLRGFRI